MGEMKHRFDQGPKAGESTVRLARPLFQIVPRAEVPKKKPRVKLVRREKVKQKS
jgi:hypothetical protein